MFDVSWGEPGSTVRLNDGPEIPIDKFDDMVVAAHSHICRDFAQRIYSGILTRSPVRTGNFRSNWNVTNSGTANYKFDFKRKAGGFGLQPRSFGAAPATFGLKNMFGKTFGGPGVIASFGGTPGAGEAGPAFFKLRNFPVYTIANGAWYGPKIEVTGWKSGKPPYQPIQKTMNYVVNAPAVVQVPTTFGLATYRSGGGGVAPSSSTNFGLGGGFGGVGSGGALGGGI